MIQDVSQKIYKALSEKLHSGEPIGKDAIDSSDIPTPIRSYLVSVLEGEADRVADGINNRRDVWIAETVDVRRARTAFAVAATRNVQLPPDRVAEVLRRTSDVVLRYLVRPSATLQSTIFERAEPSLDVLEILERMRMFSAYPYFHEVLRHYFAERKIEHVERERLDSVLHRIDRQMTTDFSPDEWLDLLAPLYETLAINDAYIDGVPADLLRIYFREKELGDVFGRLDSFAPAELIGRDALLTLLSETPSSSKDEAPESETAERQSVDPDRTTIRHLVENEPVADPAGAMVPLWKQYQRTPGQTQSAAPNPAPGPVVPMWQRFRQDGPVSPPGVPDRRADHETQSGHREPEAPVSNSLYSTHNVASAVPDLDGLERRVLGSRGTRSRRMFIQQIFNGSENDYRLALERIDEATSWAEASKVIAKDVFRRHDVNIYDEAAIGFTDMAEARFEDIDSK